LEPRHWYGLGRSCSPVGFGCWQLAGRYEVAGKPHGWSDIGAAAAVDLIHFALDRGIRFFDTAAGYGEGRSESLLGEALASSPSGKDAIVCTKVALPSDGATGALTEEVERSLHRLRRDHIDILLLHGPPDATDWHAFDRSALDGLQAAGKIRSYGVSSRSLAGAERVLEAGFGSCIEWAFHLLERRPVTALFPRLAAARMNFIARSPLSRGLLTRRASAAFPATDFRSTLPRDWMEWSAAAAARLTPLGEGAGGLGTMALRYCLSFPQVSAAIPGMHRRAQVEDLLAAAAAGPLDTAILAQIGDLAEPCYPPWA
jgi:aryl-alcohol dehydrogenase-like predicted oxidoreductase